MYYSVGFMGYLISTKQKKAPKSIFGGSHQLIPGDNFNDSLPG